MEENGSNAGELRALVERLAPAVHEAWVRQRRRDGWTHGPARDDAKKQHPSLVPFADLPESERAYDFATAEAVLAGATALGWTLTPPAPEGDGSRPLPALLARWRGEDAALRDSARPAIDLAERALDLGEPLLACDILSDARERFPGDVELRRLHALALARAGATHRARAELEDLRQLGHHRGEVLGLLARTAKDLALAATEAAERARRLAEARALYEEAHAAEPDPWTAVNAATMAVLAGDMERGRTWAERAKALAERAPVTDEWALATKAEAALILGDRAGAARCYAEYAARSRGKWARIAATRRNARILLEALGPDGAVSAALTLPRVVVSTGAPSSTVPPSAPALPAGMDWASIGFAFIAAGSGEDLLLAEQVLQRGGEVHAVLPCGRDALLGELDDEHRRRLAAVLDRAAGVSEASRDRVGGTLSDIYAGEIALGLARLRAVQLETDVVELPRSHGERTSEPASGPFSLAVRAFLFSDTVGYSKLSDPEVCRYYEHYLAAIASLAAAWKPLPLSGNTWGDAVYLAFDAPADAARFALRLRDEVVLGDWTPKGLPAGLSMRIGLHAGPSFLGADPVTRSVNVFGAHVSRAARIEPVTPHGEVYASEPFAALAVARGAPDLSFEYVGQLPLAKGYGVFPTYHVRRR